MRINQLLSLVAAVLLLLAALTADGAPAAENGASKVQNGAAPAATNGGDWKTGRVTYYGAPDSFAKAYDPTRGEGSFGILAYGSCGYTNADGQIAVPQEEAAAAADASEDYAGSCGRCYEIKCDDSIPVQDNSGNPIKISNGSYEGDKWRPYLPAINAAVTDSSGRKFTGSAEKEIASFTAKCNTDTPHKIRITDSCPCQQKLKAGAPGVTEDTTRTQQWCCASKANHFDISYYAFEKLAHPLNGVMMIKYRTIDCDTEKAAPFGHIDRNMIYSGGARAGWSWFQYDSADAQLVVADQVSPEGKASTCLKFSQGGGLQFKCRECQTLAAGDQPFAGAKAISFNIKSNGQPSDGLKMNLQKAETSSYCSNQPTTGPITAEWQKVTVPIADFNCGGVGLDQLTQFELQNASGGDAPVCIADIAIER